MTNLLNGLVAQTIEPGEIVVAVMEPAAALDELRSLGKTFPFDLRFVAVEGRELPLAKARNRAAAEASGEALIFLDIDCIAGPHLVASYRRALEAERGCFMGEVRYLPILPDPDRPPDYGWLEEYSQRHPSKPAPPVTGWVREADHGELWGLSFALRRADFEGAGGFDEAYYGYGGEETDFARRLEAAGVPLYRLADAVAYHQYHRVSIPPLGQFASIIRNARLFRERHGRWAMDYWLGQFAAMGLIDWSMEAERITILREPTRAEIEAAIAPEGTLFS